MESTGAPGGLELNQPTKDLISENPEILIGALIALLFIWLSKRPKQKVDRPTKPRSNGINIKKNADGSYTIKDED